MKTSFWTSTCSPFLFTLVPFLAACSGGGTGDDKACWEEDPPTPEGIPSAARHRARINVAEETKYNGDTEKTTRSVIAAFSDISLAEMRSRAPTPMMCDISCEGLTGAPYKHCIEDPCTLGTLDADKVEVDLGSGKITLERTATGKFVALNVAGPLFGDAPVKAVVSSRTETGFFLAYDQSLEPPDPIDLKQPDPTSSLGVGTSDLKLRWTPGNGDFVLVEVAKDDPTVTDKVRCLLQDDGCHTMGACVLDWLEIKTDEAFRLSIIRVRGAVKNLDTNTAATLNLTSQLETTIIR